MAFNTIYFLTPFESFQMRYKMYNVLFQGTLEIPDDWLINFTQWNKSFLEFLILTSGNSNVKFHTIRHLKALIFFKINLVGKDMVALLYYQALIWKWSNSLHTDANECKYFFLYKNSTKFSTVCCLKIWKLHLIL